MRRINASDLDSQAYADIARLISDGGVVCIPTDTLYGLAVDAMNPAALERLYRIKGRSSGVPVILLVDSLETLRTVCDPPQAFGDIADRFWPGPITFILEARPEVPEQITADSGSVALRWPDSRIANRIVSELGRPITSTSANRSGSPVAMSADAAAIELPDIDLIVDGGLLPGRRPSTLLDLTATPPALLREGAVSWSEVSDFFAGSVERRFA